MVVMAVVIVVMAMIVPVSMVMVVAVMVIAAIDAPHMMVVPGLRRADGGLVADDLFAVFAELAVHGIGPVTGQRFAHPVGEGVDQ